MPVAIPLTRGLVALVDEADACLVQHFRWQANVKGPHRYAQTRIVCNGRRKTVSMHRLIAAAPSGKSVDHIDGDGLNNQRANLRLVSRGQNRSNSVKRLAAASAFKGVVKYGMKWRAQISAEGRGLSSCPWYIGTFDTAPDAARAYDAVARIVFGEYARVNFPRDSEKSAIIAPPLAPLGPLHQRPKAPIRKSRILGRARVANPEEISSPGPQNAVAIKITGGITWIDPSDVESVCRYTWRVSKGRPGWSPHVRCSTPAITPSGHPTKLLHRFITDAAPGALFDHADRNGLNNTRANLRPATTSQNRINTVRRNGFGFRGIIKGPRDSGFRAKIIVDGRAINLGTFGTAEAAARAYDVAAVRHHGEWAIVNFPPSVEAA